MGWIHKDRDRRERKKYDRSRARRGLKPMNDVRVRIKGTSYVILNASDRSEKFLTYGWMALKYTNPTLRKAIRDFDPYVIWKCYYRIDNVR